MFLYRNGHMHQNCLSSYGILSPYPSAFIVQVTPVKLNTTIGDVIVRLSPRDTISGGLILPRCLDLQVSKQTHSGGMIPHLERSGMSNPIRIAYPRVAYPRDGKLLFRD